MDGLSLHYYVHPDGWENKGSATEFDEALWYKTLSKALYIEELITRHGAIMDQYDPAKKIGMIVDEWGGWYDVEPGTNPGFLYQQNTMRDALIAGLSLNIFNRHCDRVKMANIAQMVNVLQSVILTEGARMVLTPTYHVFHMYKEHQGAELLESHIEGIGETGAEADYRVPKLQESVSMGADGTIHVTLNNLSATDAEEVELVLTEQPIKESKATIVSGAMNAYNTVDEPERITEKPFEQISVNANKAVFTIPACSVAALHIQ